MSVDDNEDVTQHSNDVHIEDEPTDELLEPISTHAQLLPLPPPAPPAPPALGGRMQYRMTRAAAVAAAAAAVASVVWQAPGGDSTIDEPYLNVADSGVPAQSNFEGGNEEEGEVQGEVEKEVEKEAEEDGMFQVSKSHY